MPVTAFWYGLGLKAIANKQVDFDSDVIKVALCTATYAPDQDAHDYFDDITNEVSSSGTGYTAGGATLGSPTLTYTAGTNVLKLSGDNVSWAASTITARYAIIYDSSPGTAGTNPLLCYVDFGGNVTSTAGTFTITWAAGGIATITAA